MFHSVCTHVDSTMTFSLPFSPLPSLLSPSPLPSFPSLSSAALDYLLSSPVDPMDRAQFEESCGVGVVITKEQIRECVSVWGEGITCGEGCSVLGRVCVSVCLKGVCGTVATSIWV